MIAKWFFTEPYLSGGVRKTLPTTPKFFLVSNERYGKNKTFLLGYYGIDFAQIKRYHQFCSQACMFPFQSVYRFVSLSIIVTSFWSYWDKTYPSNHMLD